MPDFDFLEEPVSGIGVLTRQETNVVMVTHDQTLLTVQLRPKFTEFFLVANKDITKMPDRV